MQEQKRVTFTRKKNEPKREGSKMTKIQVEKKKKKIDMNEFSASII